MGIEIIYGTLTFLSALSAIFIFISILIFGLTLSKTKRFMETNVPAVYRSAKAYRNASIVFLVLVCIYVVSNMNDLITSVVRLTEDGTADEGIFYILYCVEFTAAVIGVVTGICAVAGFGKAKILYDRLYRPARPVYPQPVMYYPQQSRGQTVYPSGQTQTFPDPASYPQQNVYGQHPAEPFPYSQPAQPNYAQQAPSPVQNIDPYPAETSVRPVSSVTAAEAPAVKHCPACGTENNGSNKYCISCGRPF